MLKPGYAYLFLGLFSAPGSVLNLFRRHSLEFQR